MLDPLVSLLGSIGHALGTYSMARLLGDFVARVVDDFKRNRATARRLKQTADDESKKGVNVILPEPSRASSGTACTRSLRAVISWAALGGVLALSQLVLVVVDAAEGTLQALYVAALILIGVAAGGAARSRRSAPPALSRANSLVPDALIWMVAFVLANLLRAGSPPFALGGAEQAHLAVAVGTAFIGMWGTAVRMAGARLLPSMLGALPVAGIGAAAAAAGFFVYMSSGVFVGLVVSALISTSLPVAAVLLTVSGATGGAVAGLIAESALMCFARLTTRAREQSLEPKAQ